MKVITDVPLKNFSTFGLGGTARYFTTAHTIDDIRHALRFARKKDIPYMVLGDGSNILFSDRGYDGLIIHLGLHGVSGRTRSNNVLFEVAAGEKWDEFVSTAVKNGFHGVENLSGIPGTVGATPVQNVGAYGAEVKDVISWVEVLNTDTMGLEYLTNDECGFRYRDSIFKNSSGKKFIITKVGFNLSSRGVPNIAYRDLQNHFNHLNKKPDIVSVRAAVLAIRLRKFPDLNRYGCAGSFFKNPIISDAHLATIQKKYPTIPFFAHGTGAFKIPLAWILEHVVPWKGVRRYGVGVFHAQPLVLVHYGDGSASALKKLADDIVHTVSKSVHVIVTPEISLVGKF